MQSTKQFIFLLLIWSVLLLTSCAVPVSTISENDSVLAYFSENNDILSTNTPVFLIKNPKNDFNRIGTPVVEIPDEAKPVITVSTNIASVYVEERQWRGKAGLYKNLIYRIHFPEVPFQFIPFNLIAGSNVGLLFIVTLDKNDQPLLYTTLHTCGCYLAFTPTSHLSPEFYPEGWPNDRQGAYGENLPARLRAPGVNEQLYIVIGESTHRVKNLWIDSVKKKYIFPNTALHIAPLSDLQKLTTAQGSIFSFFETEGSRKDYVVGSQKIWERLFISWWALDWRVGEDKRLGRDINDGIVFYTSLKPWARESSDLRNFPAFLDYWGWNL